MDWVRQKRRGPQWKQGWTDQTIASISAPPFQLLALFAIALLLLSLSRYTGYKAQLESTRINFQLFLFILPIMLIFLVSYFSTAGNKFNFRIPGRPPQGSFQLGGGSGSASPWGVAALVVVLLVLLSYQSSFHSKWFGHY